MTARQPKLRMTEEGQEKLCTKCDEWWPADLEFFYADRAGAGGLFYCCKACFVEHVRPRERRRVAALEAP